MTPTFRHRLLLRQIRKNLGPDAEIPEAWIGLLRAVEAAYEQFDSDRRLVERAMAVSSDELIAANEELRSQNARNLKVVERLRALARSLNPDHPDSDTDLVGLSDVIEELVRRRQEVEETLRSARDAAEAANRAKSDFLTNMSHEIRTPLNAMMGLASLIPETPSEDERREFVETILESGRALLRIMGDILDFSRIEAGQLTFEAKPFDVRECVGQSVRFVTAHRTKPGVELGVDVAADVPARVVGDSKRLAQVLVNLVDNAMKFTDAGSIAVGVTAAREGPDWRLRFTVADTGIGIPPDRIDRLFKSFSQVDTSTTRRYSGTGLGLAISRRLVEMMGGGVGVESAPGKGSTFRFDIRAPAAPADAP